MSSNPCLRVTELGKCYRIYQQPRDRILQAFWGSRRTLYREFWALKSASFELEKGKTLGVMGRNGSGKSTLLQLICGTLTPSQGHIDIRGRIGALLELGSGFNPEFTGLENIFFNASLLGLSRQETSEKLDDILAFADIGEFVHQPVKTYSSGMGVRLAFAVQAHIEPDILVVDEALAVGDEMFQKKCYARLETLKERGTSILLVTHSCPQIVQHCDLALLLEHGEQTALGDPKEITALYERLNNEPSQPPTTKTPSEGQSFTENHIDEQTSEPSDKQANEQPDLKPASTVVYPSHGARIEDVQVLDANNDPISLLSQGEPFVLSFRYHFEKDTVNPRFGCNISNQTGARISGQVYPTPKQEDRELVISADSRCDVRFYFRGGLLPGLYFVSGGIWLPQTAKQFLHRVIDIKAFRVASHAPTGSFGLCDLMDQPPSLRP